METKNYGQIEPSNLTNALDRDKLIKFISKFKKENWAKKFYYKIYDSETKIEFYIDKKDGSPTTLFRFEIYQIEQGLIDQLKKALECESKNSNKQLNI